MNIERTPIANNDFNRKVNEEPTLAARSSLTVHLLAENARLLAQIEELLPWAKLGARAGVTDSTWDEAHELLRRIEMGEFGEQS